MAIVRNRFLSNKFTYILFADIKIIRIAMDDDLTTIEPNSDNPNAYANNNDSKENSNEVVPYWGQDVYVIEC